jgi:glycosyltransferase involved in cell wall biosynthesis
MAVRVTLALLAYNQERYVEAALTSALAQVCEPIEIIASDDGSDDGTFAAIQRVARGYAGPHRLAVRRNEVNVGIGAHFNALMRIAEGQLVALMAGDDISLPERIARTIQAWQDHGERPDLVAANVFDMTEDGRDAGIKHVDRLQEWGGVEDWARRRPFVIGAAHAVTRRLFDRFGPLARNVFHEDQINTLRAICAGGAITIDEPLVRYRRGGLSWAPTSAKAFRALATRRNAMHLAMLEQWKRDAAIAGRETLVADAIDWAVQQENFIKGLLEAPTLAAQLRWVHGHRGIELRWRLKRLAQLRMPRTAVAAKRIQSQWGALPESPSADESRRARTIR